MNSLKPQPGAQSLFLSSQADIAIYGGSAGSGKRLSVDTLIPTSSGFKCMGELNIGDKVFAIDGSIAKVTYVSPIEIAYESYEVEFDTGEIIVADEEHLWKTMTEKDRNRAFVLTEEFRIKRRLTRLSRSKSVKIKPSSSINITNLNHNRVYEYKDAPNGEIRTTYEIMDSLCVRSGRINHSVDVAKPINTQYNEFIVEPYLFGLWLGDGYSSAGMIGCMESDMDEIKNYIHSEILSERVEIANRKKPFKILTIKGLYRYIRTNELIKNKHIPLKYLRASIEQRNDLLCGLMDTDGTCSVDGRCSITLSNKRLIEDVQELICSLGIKCSITSKYLKKYGTFAYTIHFNPDFHVFKLIRKKERQNIDHIRSSINHRRFIVDVRKTEPKYMRCIAIDHDSHLYLVGRTFIPTHNTAALLLEAARHVGVSGYNCALFRREFKQVVSTGGIRDAALQIYPLIGATYRSQPTPQFLFPSGAKISFAHLNSESETLAWQGAEICMIGFDELTHFTQYQFEYLMSRNRSTCGVRPLIRATTNPDADSWVADFISYWINQETGYPIKERSGQLRYMIRVKGERKWGDSVEELVKEYGCEPNDPKSVTFVNAKITDNPILLRKDPGYLANLKALSRVERARLLDGNWKIRAVAGMYFPRFDATIIDWKPNDVLKWIRSWDLAASEESEGRDPDFTVGLLAGRRPNGKIVIADLIRVRRKAAEVRSLVKNLAHKDGKEVWLSVPRDPGQAGKEQAESYLQMLQGFTVISRAITKNKLTMAEPAAALWQQGNIEIVRAPWNEVLLQELEQFPEGRHDDIVDCLSAASRNLPGHAKPDYSHSGLSGRFKEVRSQRKGQR